MTSTTATIERPIRAPHVAHDKQAAARPRRGDRHAITPQEAAARASALLAASALRRGAS